MKFRQKGKKSSLQKVLQAASDQNED